MLLAYGGYLALGQTHQHFCFKALLLYSANGGILQNAVQNAICIVLCLQKREGPYASAAAMATSYLQISLIATKQYKALY